MRDLSKLFLRVLGGKALFLALLLFASNAKAQYVTIPDSNFATWMRFYGYYQCINGNQLDTACAAQVSANNRYANISYFKISDLEGIQYFKNLDSLRCNADTMLTHIPALPPKLKVFECRNNYLDSLPALPDSLQRLVCDFNQLTKLPALPATLTYLSCINNALHTLPPLPNGLALLYCSGNDLDSLPALPQNVTYLSCFSNNLTQLPALPASLVQLSCSGNVLVSLPSLPPGLVNLDCYNNRLTSLPALPATLNFLACNKNQLSQLPALPAALTGLNCEKNQLTSLPELPNSLSILFCNNNAGLFCLPQLKTIGDLEFYNTGITCAPNYGNVATSNPSLGSLPLCATGNAHGCLVVSGVEDEVGDELKVYPNPANDYVIIDAREYIGGTIVVMDVNGRKLSTQEFKQQLQPVNTGVLNAGLYLISITDEKGQVHNNRLVIQR